MRHEILRMLENNSRIDLHDLAIMLGTDESVVLEEIEKMENEGIICGYPTLINWDKTDTEKVTAFIEVRVTPQRGQGFEKLAETVTGYLAKEYDSHFGNRDRKRLYHQLFRRHDGNDYQRNQCSVHIGHKRRRRAVLLGARRPNHRNRRAENKGRRFRRHHPAATHQSRKQLLGGFL